MREAAPKVHAREHSLPEDYIAELERIEADTDTNERCDRRRDRLFAYPRDLHILSEGTEPLRNH